MTDGVEIIVGDPMDQMNFGEDYEGSGDDFGDDLEIDDVFDAPVPRNESLLEEKRKETSSRLYEIGELQKHLDNIHEVDTRLMTDRIRAERLVRSSFAFSDFCRVAQSKVQRERQRDLRGALDESTCVSTDHAYYEIVNEPSDFKRTEYQERRGVEIRSLYEKLGCVAQMTAQNCFGSYREIAQAAYDRRSDWTSTKVTTWLNKLIPSTTWSGTESPYTEILPYLPPKVHSYLDFGCGSGNGARQVWKYVSQPSVFCGYDIQNYISSDNGKCMKFLNVLNSTYDLVTMVNVLHHVQDAKKNIIRSDEFGCCREIVDN